MIKRSLISAFVFVSFFGCKKEPLPEPIPDEPVFYLHAKVQGIAVRIEAGSDGYQMVPGFFQDTSGVYVLTSDLQKPGCQDCYELSLKLNAHTSAAMNGPVMIDSALRTGTYSFNDRALPPVQYRMQLQPVAAEDPTGSYLWTVKTDGEPDRTFSTYKVEFLADAIKKYSVSLYYADATGCTNTLVRTFMPGNTPAANIIAQHQGNLVYSFGTDSYGLQPVSYHWDFGDGATSQAPNPDHTFVAAPGIYLITLTLTFADGKTTTVHYQVPGTTDPVCLSNFRADVSGIANTSSSSKIVVVLRDPSGNTYSSLDFVQPGTSNFKIVSVDDYESNKQGYRTKRFKALFNCVLRQNGQEIVITDGEASLGVAYK